MTRDTEIEEALLAAEEHLHATRLEHKTLDELNELEDLEDPTFLESYRQKRIQELADYENAVTDASHKWTVMVALVSPVNGHPESRLLSGLWKRAAEKWRDVKFVEMRADLAIEGYPERNCPTVLVYQKGDIVRQIVTLRELGGMSTKLEDIERILVESKAVKTSDYRLRSDDRDDDRDEATSKYKSIRVSQKAEARGKVDDDDDDWD
ncbi:thioredoxin-like protein [Kalaharituber pfeilii]|nr:thioredoxin-like protein [Kalaharituber pfeilii]